VSVHIDWGALGAVFLVSFGAAVGVIVLFAFGVSTLTPPTTNPTTTPDHTTQGLTLQTVITRPIPMLCFLTCALAVAYSLYLIIA
jgi:hypothetical protein